MPTEAAASVTVTAADLVAAVSGMLHACGVREDDAAVTAEALVAADLEGVRSHGTMLLPMYVERLRAGSVDPAARARVVEAHGAQAVIDAGHGLGQPSSALAVDEALRLAATHGVAVVSVRHAFHFGAAGWWARRIAEAGAIGIVMSNTRPLMPAPGGAERVVGNNPLALAFPAEPGRAVVVDMATSAIAMGSIRLAAARGEPIPEGWATDAQGVPTRSPQEAIAGMLLPAAGPKGFGLAVAVDLLCGGLSGGALGAQVRPLYGNAAVPYDCAHAFVAIRPIAHDGQAPFADRAAQFAQSIRGSRPAPGVGRLYAPGDLERERRERAAGVCQVSGEFLGQFNALAHELGRPPLATAAS